MNLEGLLAKLRKYIVMTGMGGGAAIFWGAAAAVVAKVTFGVEEMHAWIFVGLPVGVIFMAWIWRKLPEIFELD